MTDKLSPERRSRNMANIRATDTKPEMAVRRFVHGLGYRFRLHKTDLPGRPDLVFPSKRKVIFVHGCFWHQHADRSCKIVRRPKSGVEYWNAKLDRNVARDAAVKKALKSIGWTALTIWECQVRAGPETLERSVRKFLDG
jgi:DNA mismatch endonuclease (patch repair protein)